MDRWGKLKIAEEIKRLERLNFQEKISDRTEQEVCKLLDLPSIFAGDEDLGMNENENENPEENTDVFENNTKLECANPL